MKVGVAGGRRLKCTTPWPGLEDEGANGDADMGGFGELGLI